MQTKNLFKTFLFSLLSLILHSSLTASTAGDIGMSVSSYLEVEMASTAPPPCFMPTWLMTTNITQTSATFSWDPVVGAVDYSVQTRVPNGT